MKKMMQECKDCVCKSGPTVSTGNGVYGLGVIGTAFYFLQHAQGGNEIVMGIVKAVFWPAILVYHALTLLNL
jgi:hypothetical protein